ncbi:MAG: response regulator transcription factor [Phycisphaerales bacterium]|nr:response regulator transcription factor [Phycisphaerales bacterium]
MKISTLKRIVVVEDEADLADLLAYNLQRSGYDVSTANSGEVGLRTILETAPDLVVLDIMLPQLSGLEVAREVRTNPRTAAIPILMLTAKAAEADQLAGLGMGADDYVTKPFSMKVVIARIEALLRRSPNVTNESQAVLCGPVEADLATHRVLVDGEEIKTTLTEFRLLVALMRAKGKALSRYELMSRAMGPGVMVTTRTIDVHVAAIRKKLGQHSPMIRTIRGVGYRMTDRPEEFAPDEAGEVEAGEQV